eukprot:TRINITY_DN9474_c0_g1_i2.p1 TRINITY_DN9474_c0_g1~~TRINITY_DN9474_c0_g1_i2.p1  ORF type:complete len:398 (-),score=51.13 TRINITY_DN9474_c0_g1_i2:271-1464(-)
MKVASGLGVKRKLHEVVLDASDNEDADSSTQKLLVTKQEPNTEEPETPGAVDLDGLEYVVVPKSDRDEASAAAPQSPSTAAQHTASALSAILADDIYLSAPDREYLGAFFNHLGMRRASDLVDMESCGSVQQYLRVALQSYELQHGSAGGSVRCALGRLVRTLVPDGEQKPSVETIKTESPQAAASSQRKPSALRVARVGAKTWTSRRLPGSAMPTVCPVPVRRRQPTKPALVGLSISAHNLKDRKGNSLPEVRWVVDGHQRVGEVVRRWGIDVLKLPDNKLPGGATGGVAELIETGIVALGQSGPVPLDARVCKIVDTLEAVGGHRGLSIQWPLSSLPKDWGIVKESKKQKKSKHCSDCGDALTFRRCAADEGFRTFAICPGCDAVKGCFFIRKQF